VILHSLRLKEFKGLRAGVGLGEVVVDFSRLPASGLIAVVGGNGMGKTTILDNCHPYRLMPYKLRKAAGWSPAAFSFYDQCYGQEAVKELVFEMAGTRYKSLLLIDADRRKQEAYLYRESTGGWQPVNDGKTRTYDEAVEALCGSPSLFFTSVFRAQGARNLSDYTRGDIMAVVAELLNIDHVREQGEKARKVAGLLMAEVDALTRDRAGFELAAGSLPVLRDERMAAAGEAALRADEAAGLRAKIDDLLRRKAELEVANAAVVSTQQRIADKQAELSRVRGSIAMIEQEHLGNIAAGKKKVAELQAEIDTSESRYAVRCGEYTRRRHAVSGVLSRADEIRAAVTRQADTTEALRVASERLQALREDYAQAQAEAVALSSLPSQLASARATLSSLRTRVAALDAIDCRADGTGWVNEACPLLKDAVEAKGRIDASSAEVEALEGRLGALTHANQRLADLKVSGEVARTDVQALQSEVAALADVARLLPELDMADARLAEVAADEERDRQQWAERKSALEISLFAHAATVGQLETTEDTRLAPLRAETERLDRETKELSAAISDRPDSAIRAVDQEAAATRAMLAGTESREKELQAAIGRLDAKIEAAEKAASQLALIDAKVDGINADVADWYILAKACSNDGICALELDDAGPMIAAISNDLLKACYGPRFSVRLETQSAKVNGDMKEDFDITVFDAETGEVKSITEMSGGQTCWIEDALTRAICLFNINRSDRIFGTLYSDEKDGALDAGRKCEFMAVKHRSLQVGSHSRELFITQTPDLIDMADAVIRLSPGSVSLEVR